MSWFVDEPAATAAVVAANASRAAGAGVDPFEYAGVTGGLATLREWLAAFRASGERHEARAEAATGPTAAGAWRRAAASWHIATIMPNPDRVGMREAAYAAARAYRRYLGATSELLDLAGRQFTGEVRLPAERSGDGVLALVLSGLDSARSEFMDLSDALLARGVTVVAFDGPGQGVHLDRAQEPDYERVVAEVLDAVAAQGLRFSRTVAIGLSLGGLYGLTVAAREPRVDAFCAISGLTSLPGWEQLPPFAIDTFRLRAGDTARAVVDRLSALDVAGQVRCPVWLVAGTADTLPTPEQARALASRLPRGRLTLLDGGDHLCGNRRWLWLDEVADWAAAARRRIPPR